MQTKADAIAIVDELLAEAEASNFSYVSIKAKTVAEILQNRTGAPNHAMPTCCKALRERFRQGRDFFRRGKDRQSWSSEVDGDETSTFEVLFEINR